MTPCFKSLIFMFKNKMEVPEWLSLFKYISLMSWLIPNFLSITFDQSCSRNRRITMRQLIFNQFIWHKFTVLNFFYQLKKIYCHTMISYNPYIIKSVSSKILFIFKYKMTLHNCLFNNLHFSLTRNSVHIFLAMRRNQERLSIRKIIKFIHQQCLQS